MRPGYHLCVAQGCNATIPNTLLMCRHHWMMLSNDAKREVYQWYRSPASHERTAAIRRAIEEVAAVELRERAS